jgi:hypothetical protein
MKTVIFVLLFVMVLTSPQFSQTQLLKVGNAAGFGEGWSQSYLDITVDEVTINGKNYFKRKLRWFNPLADCIISYERIEGDSVYYVLSSTNTDILAFNFNWPIGAVTYSYNTGTVIYERRIGSIYVQSDLIPQDTIYIINWYMINISTGDTMSYGDPFYDKYSRKLGLMYSGLGGQLQGAKIDGVRYGDIMQYPEEIDFSEDSIYIPALGDTGSVKIVNTSDHSVRIDSINSVGAFYGYRGFLSKPGFEYPFYLFQTLPSPQWNDTLGIVIPPHDSINVSFYEVDLCPICDYEVQNYFKDTLRFVFTFMDGNVYSFSNSIPISGEGHPSNVDEKEIPPNEFVLNQNYPNPFNPSTSIQYAISSRQFVSLKIYDVLGNEISTLVNEYRDAGNYEAEFNAEKLSSGVYYYQLIAGNFVETKKMILLR